VQSSPFLQTQAVPVSHVAVEVGPASGTEPFVPEEEDDVDPEEDDEEDEVELPSSLVSSDLHATMIETTDNEKAAAKRTRVAMGYVEASIGRTNERGNPSDLG
jgi:hypothetical protein